MCMILASFYQKMMAVPADRRGGGTIPNEIGIFTKLTGLNVGTLIGSKINLFVSIARLSANTFHLVGDDRTKLYGTLPTELGTLTQLNYLDLRNNTISGSIPSEIGLLTQLTYLELSGNILSGTIPSEIGLLTQLTYMNVKDNGLDGTIPSEIGDLTQLTFLI